MGWGIERGGNEGLLTGWFFDILLLLLLLLVVLVPGVKSFLFRFFSFFFFFAFTPEGLIPVNLSDSYIYLHVSRVVVSS